MKPFTATDHEILNFQESRSQVSDRSTFPKPGSQVWQGPLPWKVGDVKFCNFRLLLFEQFLRQRGDRPNNERQATRIWFRNPLAHEHLQIIMKLSERGQTLWYCTKYLGDEHPVFTSFSVVKTKAKLRPSNLVRWTFSSIKHLFMLFMVQLMGNVPFRSI